MGDSLMKMWKLLLVAVGGAGLTTPALAAEIAPIVMAPAIIAAPAPAPTSLAGYVELFGGLNFGREIELDDCDPDGVCDLLRGFNFGGAASVAWAVRPHVSLQLETWLRQWDNWSAFCDDCGIVEVMRQMGAATHLTFNGSGGLQAGTFASIGAVSPDDDPSVLVTFGGEFAFNAARFRFVQQGGYVIGLTGEAGPDGDRGRDIYSRTVATFYARPNLALSANFGIDHYREACETCDYHELGLTWGGRLEFQPAGRPFSIFTAYQGTRWVDLTEDGRYQTDHFFSAGISFNFGATDLQSRDAAVGFQDYNPMYGRTPFLDHL